MHPFLLTLLAERGGGPAAGCQVLRDTVSFASLSQFSWPPREEYVLGGGCCSFSQSLGMKKCETDLNPT